MEYRRLGHSGMNVSEIAYGSWRTAGGGNDPDLSIDCHLKAFELGVTMFDTADVYNRGEAEEIVGRVLQKLSRKDIVLATKCRGKMGDGPNDKGLSRKHIMEACEASLRRLKTDYIDLYQAHTYDPDTPLEETVRAFNDLIRQGKILYWGVSNWSGAQVRDAVALCALRGYDRPPSHQPRYSMLTRDIEKEVMPACEQHGLGLICYSPLAKGMLTGKYKDGQAPSGSWADREDNFKKSWFKEYNFFAVRELHKIADGMGLTLSNLALAWLLGHEVVSAAIVGARLPEQVEENVKASGIKLDDEIQKQIERVLDVRWAMVLEEDAKTLREEKSST